MDKKSLLTLGTIFFIVFAIIFGINIRKINLKEKIKFTEDNHEYIYNDIINSFGDGEEFHVEEVKEEYVETLITVKGSEVTYIGYFDSQDRIYLVKYGKYFEDKPVYKNGKAGNVIWLTVNANYSKEEYLKSKGEKND